MNVDGTKRNLLNLWVSDFMHHYTPDPRDHSTARLMYEQLRSTEARHGFKLVSEPWTVPEGKSELYQAGEILAQEWNVPITQLGLTALTLGCQTEEDVLMMMAVAYLRFIQMGPPSDHPLDTAAVTTIFQYGTASRDFLDDKWKLQQISGYDGSPGYDLLRHVSSNEFDSLSPRTKVSTPL